MFRDVDGEIFECTSHELGPHASDTLTFDGEIKWKIPFLPISRCVWQVPGEFGGFGVS